MEFNTSTFIFEIINFLVLIWILQRLFYKPLLEVIAKRKQFIDQSLADAKTLHQQAEEQRTLYENRQKLWEQEKQAAHSTLQQQLDIERKAQMDKLTVELEQERQKSIVTLTRQQQMLQDQLEKKALQNGARFAGILLQQSANPDLEIRLIAMLLEHLGDLPESCRLCLQTLEAKKSVLIKISSAYPLTPELRQQLEQKLSTLINRQINFQYRQDSDLIAGLRIEIGAWILHANLKHELSGFAEIAHEFE
ncbi:MAG: F0F1 ATP synthase subunit delta [Methylococcaceae bacterium]